MEQEEKNPWEEGYQISPSMETTPVEQEKNPWEDGYQAEPSLPAQPEDRMPTETEVLAGEDPLYSDLNRMRESGELDAIPAEEPTRVVRSYDELYGGVRNKPEYQQLREFEDTSPFSLYRDLAMPEELKAMKTKRDTELEKIYSETGEEVESPLGFKYRVQEQKFQNPDFPVGPEGPVNQPYVSKRFVVDPPDQEPLMRMGYQILENIVGGVGDLVTEGKISGEGEFSGALPDTVPNETGEAFATEMASYIVGGAGAAKIAGKALGGASTLATRAGAALSPEAQASIREAYQMGLRATGSSTRAMQFAANQSKRLMIGLSLGLVEGTVAPDDSEGFAVSPERVKKYFNVDDQRAKDISLVLDAPVIGGTLTAMGKLYDGVVKKAAAKTLGGIRNFNPWDIGVGRVANKLSMNDKDAGLKLITWLDPELAARSSPEEAVFRIKVLADSLERNATKNLKLSGAQGTISMDTPAAFAEVAEDYYRTAYGNLKHRPDALNGVEYDEWVKDKAAQAANRLFELRTGLMSDATVSQKMSRTSSDLDELLSEGAEAQAPRSGSLEAAQEGAGNVLAQEQRMAEQLPLDTEAAARTKMEGSRKVADEAISTDPEIQRLIQEADVDDLGSKSKLNKKLMETLSEPLYRSFKNLRGKVDDAYGKIAKTDVKGDPESIFQIIKDSGHVDKDGNITNPILNRIAQNVRRDATFSNIYNNVRKDISTAIGNTANGSDPAGIRDTLLQLSNNVREGQLDFMRASGQADIVKMVDEAKSAYTNYRTAFDERSLKNLANREGRARLSGEKYPHGVGIGQGRADWDINSVRTIQSGLEGVTGERFREELDRAVKAGGEDISQPLAEYYTTEAVSNLANKLKSGDKESVRTLRGALRGVVENLQRSGQTGLIDTFKRVEARVEALENVAKLDEKAYDNILKDVDNLKKKAQESVLNKFLASGQGLGQAGTAQKLKTIFKSAEARPQLEELLKKADTLGDRGIPIREAIKGTYLDAMRERMFSSKALGASEIKGGVVESGFKANENNIRKMFQKGSKDLDSLKLIFKDQPEIIKELEDIGNTLSATTKTTPNKSGDIFGPVASELDPEKGMSAATTLMFGVLNPTATRVRKFTGPLSIDSLGKVREARNAVLVAMMTDPKGFSNMAKAIAKDTQNKEAISWARGIVARAGLRAYGTTNEELDKLK